MSIWSRIMDALSALAHGEGLSAFFERLRTPPERSVAFTIAIIALAAKMAKADGQVTRDEVATFRQIFTIPAGEEENAARVFNLARQDVAGYEAWARRIAEMFHDEPATLREIMDGLFMISVADGNYHQAEDEFLVRVAAIFGLSEQTFRALRKAHVPDAMHDPWDVLDVPHDAPIEDVRSAWKRAVRENHPDRLQARGVPPEALRLAEARLIAVNQAWDHISGLHAA